MSVNLSLSLNTGLWNELFWKWRAEEIRVFGPEKEEVTREKEYWLALNE